VNIQEYISSGIIESYVLGLAPAEERIEFEQLCSRHPELVEARKKFEEAIERQAMENAPAPPEFLKEKTWSQIQQSSTKIITMEPTTRSRSGFSWVAAASIILFLAAGYFAYKFYDESRQLKRSNDELAQRADSIQKEKDELNRILQDPNVTVVNMKAMKPEAPSASIFWDTTSSNVYLVVKNMPRLATDQQYQLWSIIDSAGKLQPTSLGLFDGGNEKLFFRMQNAQNADHFAITIEKRGNTEGPNLNQLQVMGDTKRKL
jgi:anti-sigma-K factor RskA